MSDQVDKNFERLAKAAAQSLEKDQVGAADAGPVKAGKPEQMKAQTVADSPARKGSSAIAWIALLLVLAVVGGAGWLLQERQGIDAAMAARLQALEATTGQESPALGNLDELEQRWQGQLNSALERMRQDSGAFDSQVNSVDSQLGDITQALAVVQAQLVEQRTEIATYSANNSANDSSKWQLAEAQYLLRLAHQRLLMAGDVEAAQGLLSSADRILQELDDVRFFQVRAALASDLAAVRALPKIDVEGAYLRLAALVEQAEQLVIFQLPKPEAQPAREPAGNWQARLREGYEAALDKLSNYVIIRRRDVPMQALMDPQWEGMVRQNLRMLLEQAQLALLSGNQLLFRESLGRAQHWVSEFYASDEAAAQAMSREITQLADVVVASSLPDISGSVQAFDEAMKQGLEQGGAE